MSRKRAQAVAALAGKMGRRYAPDRATIDRFRVDCREQTIALALVRAFAAAAEFDRPIVLYGSVGTGKDHLLAALLYAAAQSGRSVGWVNGQEVYSRFRDAMDSKQSEESLMAQFVAPQVLGISDPIPPVVDPHKPAAWRTELLFRVLDARYRDCKPTWATLNAQSPADAEGKLSEPVFDRLKDGAVLVPCFWPSYREHKK
jgi:DNA replication protein DnaC